MELVFVLDCRDSDGLADFWAAALQYDRGDYASPYVPSRTPPSSAARSWTTAGRPRCSPTRRATSSA